MQESHSHVRAPGGRLQMKQQKADSALGRRQLDVAAHPRAIGQTEDEQNEDRHNSHENEMQVFYHGELLFKTQQICIGERDGALNQVNKLLPRRRVAQRSRRD